MYGIIAIALVLILLTTKKVSGSIMSYRTVVEVWGSLAKKYSILYSIDVSLILAIIKQESDGNQYAEGSTGDVGLMQITQPALTDFNVHNATKYDLNTIYQSEFNVKVGSWLLRHLYNQTDNWKDAIRAYNVGLTGSRKNATSGLQYAESVLIHKQEITKILMENPTT